METIPQTKTLVELTYEALLTAICSGELLPGERLNQDELAARLNVSRQPVNSAISILKANGFAQDTGRRSVVVTELAAAHLSEIFEFRELIEPFAVLRAAERLPKDAHVAARASIKLGRKAVARGDVRALVQADAEFHQMIYRWSGNHVIENSMRVNWHHIRRAMAEVLRNPAAASPSWDAHERIVEALLTGQAKIAASEMMAHIEQARARTLATLDKPSE